MAEVASAGKSEEFLSKQLLNHLMLIRSNFSFGLQFWALLRDPKTAEGLQVHRIVVKADGVYAIPPGSACKGSGLAITHPHKDIMGRVERWQSKKSVPGWRVDRCDGWARSLNLEIAL